MINQNTLETKKTAVDMFFIKLCKLNQDLAMQMLKSYMECKTIENIQMMNAVRLGRDTLNNTICPASYLNKTYGDGSKDINSKQTPTLVYATDYNEK
jgi:hypothetical protein